MTPDEIRNALERMLHYGSTAPGDSAALSAVDRLAAFLADLSSRIEQRSEWLLEAVKNMTDEERARFAACAPGTLPAGTVVWTGVTQPSQAPSETCSGEYVLRQRLDALIGEMLREAYREIDGGNHHPPAGYWAERLRKTIDGKYQPGQSGATKGGTPCAGPGEAQKPADDTTGPAGSDKHPESSATRSLAGPDACVRCGVCGMPDDACVCVPAGTNPLRAAPPETHFTDAEIDAAIEAAEKWRADADDRSLPIEELCNLLCIAEQQRRELTALLALVRAALYDAGTADPKHGENIIIRKRAYRALHAWVLAHDGGRIRYGET